MADAAGGRDPPRAAIVAVDVIIVTYNSAASLGAAVSSARACPQVGHIIVVDNASTDGSADVGRQGGADEVIGSPENLGFAKAVNLGLRHTDAGLILLLNPDAHIDEACLTRLLDALAAHRGAAIAAPVLTDASGQLALGAVRFSTLINRVGMCLPLLGHMAALRPEYRFTQHIVSEGVVTPVESLWGAVMLLDGSFLRAVGGLDERFFLFSEDEDLCRQAREQGRSVLLVGGARAFHEGGASSSDASLREARRLFAAYQLVEKWEGRRRADLFRRGIAAAFHLREAAFALAAFRMVRPGPGAADVPLTLNLFRFMVSRERAL